MPRISIFFSPALSPWLPSSSPPTACSGGVSIDSPRRASNSKVSVLSRALAGIPAPHPPARAPTRLPKSSSLPVPSASAEPRIADVLLCECARKATLRTLAARLHSSCPAPHDQNIPAIGRDRRRAPRPALRARENAGPQETKLVPPPQNGTELRWHIAGALPVAMYRDPRRRLATPAPVARRAPARAGADAKAGLSSDHEAWPIIAYLSAYHYLPPPFQLILPEQFPRIERTSTTGRRLSQNPKCFNHESLQDRAVPLCANGCSLCWLSAAYFA